MNPLEIKGGQMKVWSAVKEYMEARLDGMCMVCLETPQKLHIHHRNGCALDNRIENLIAVCPSCHRKIHGHNLDIEAMVKIDDATGV